MSPNSTDFTAPPPTSTPLSSTRKTLLVERLLRLSMSRDHYWMRPHTPSPARGRAAGEAPARSPYTQEEDPPHLSYRPRTPGPGRTGDHARPYDDLPGVSYVSALPPGRSEVESHQRALRTDDLPYDAFQQMSLYPSRPASRPTNYQSEDADQNVRPGGALQERRRYTPVEHGASDQLPSVLRSRSISHSNTQEGRSSWIPPDVVPGPAAQGYTEYAYRGQATRDQRREDYRGETPRAPAELDSRGRPVRRQSSNENTRPRAASTGFASRRDVSRGGPVPLGERPEFIIVGLFVLRLAKRVIERLDSYPERRADLAWIDSFLTYYRADDDLAELRGAAMDEFAKTNPAIISHFIKQPRYPIAFMEVDPTPRGREVRRLTDKEARDMVDFADAAAEWGSNVKLPGNERDRMEAIAAQRKIALYGS